MHFTPEQTSQIVAIVAMVLGVLSRTLLPFLTALRDDPTVKFDRKFIVPALVSVVLNLILLPLVVEATNIPTSFVGGYIAGWGAQDITRQLIVAFGPKVGMDKLV